MPSPKTDSGKTSSSDEPPSSDASSLGQGTDPFTISNGDKDTPHKNNNSSSIINNRHSTTYSEWLMPGLRMEMKLERVIAAEQSAIQKVEILQTFFGKTLVLDGYTQSAQFDEFVYHESLVHPALLKLCTAATTRSTTSATAAAASTTPPPPPMTTTAGGTGTGSQRRKGPKRVFIGGGGELATAREVLRYPSVEQVIMVDLDATVVKLCQQHLPEWGGTTVANDPRLQIVIGDAYEYLQQIHPKTTSSDENESLLFDAIFLDICDPVEAGPGLALYTQEFYRHAATLLTPGGVLVTQGGAADAVPHQIVERNGDDCMALGPIRNTLAQVFAETHVFSTHIASFGGDWGFVMACRSWQEDNGEKTDHATNQQHYSIDWKKPPPGFLDGLIEQNITGGSNVLRHYDGESHERMFALTKPLRKYLASETRIMTMANPIYTF